MVSSVCLTKGLSLSNLSHEAMYMCHSLLQMCCNLHAQQHLNLQLMTHKGNAAGLMSLTTEGPEGRQVLAQHRMSGRVAQLFTSDRSDHLQVGSFCAHITYSLTVFGDCCALHRTCTDSVVANQRSTTT